MKRLYEVAQPEWLKEAVTAMEDTCRLYLRGGIPKKIEAWMLTVACRRMLRSIYGSDPAADEAMRQWTAENAELDEAYKDVTDIQ